MAADELSGVRIAAEGARREHVLPPPLPRSIRVLARQGCGQRDARPLEATLGFEPVVESCQVRPQRPLDAQRQHGGAVATTLRLTNDDFTTLQLQVLDPQT